MMEKTIVSTEWSQKVKKYFFLPSFKPTHSLPQLALADILSSTQLSHNNFNKMGSDVTLQKKKKKAL